AIHVVVLVTPQVAEIAELVDEALAALVLMIEVAPDGERERSFEHGTMPVQSQADAAVVAVEVGHAARRRCAAAGERQILPDQPAPAVRVDMQGKRIGKMMIDARADLLLVDRLARVEQESGRIRAARVGAPFGARETEGILRLRLKLRVADQRDPRIR